MRMSTSGIRSRVEPRSGGAKLTTVGDRGKGGGHGPMHAQRVAGHADRGGTKTKVMVMLAPGFW